jgi:hypothetical protein
MNKWYTLKDRVFPPRLLLALFIYTATCTAFAPSTELQVLDLAKDIIAFAYDKHPQAMIQPLKELSLGVDGSIAPVDPLRDWLSSLIIPIPLKKDPIFSKFILGCNITLWLEEVEIAGIEIGDIETTYVEPQRRSAPLSFKAVDIGTRLKVHHFHLHLSNISTILKTVESFLPSGPAIACGSGFLPCTIDSTGNITLTIGNVTEFGTGYQVTNWISDLGPILPDPVAAGAGANSSFWLGITDLLIVDDPDSSFEIGMLLQAFTPPGAYYKVSTLANARLGLTVEGIIDTKVGNIFNFVFAAVDTIVGGQMALFAPPYVIPQPHMPKSVNFKELFGFKGAKLLRKELSVALAKLADLILPTGKFGHFNNIPIKALEGKNITIDLAKFLPALPATVRLTLQEANITGLLDIGEVLPLVPLCDVEPMPAVCGVEGGQNQTLRTSIGLKALSVTLVATIEILDDLTGKTLSDETVTAVVTIDKPTINLDTTIQVEHEYFGNLKLGQLLNLTEIKHCIIGSIQKLDLQSISIDMDIRSIKVTTSAMGLRKEMDAILIDLVTLIIDSYRAVVPPLVNHIISSHDVLGNGNITTFINLLSDSFLPTFTGANRAKCQKDTPQLDFSKPKLIDWSKPDEFPLAKLLSEATKFLNKELHLTHEKLNLNAIIAGLTKVQSGKSGTLVLENKIPPFTFNSPEVGKFMIDVHDVSIDALNSFYSLGLIVPENNKSSDALGTVLDNELALAMAPDERCQGFYGDTPLASCGPLNVTLKAKLSYIAPGAEGVLGGNAFSDEITITISLSNISFAARLNVSIDSNILHNLTYGAVLHDKEWKMAHASEAAQWGESVCIGDSIKNLSLVSDYENTNLSPLSKWTKKNHLDFATFGLTISDVGQPSDSKGRHMVELMPRIAKLEKALGKYTNKLLGYYGPYMVPRLLNPVLEKLVVHTQNCTGKFPPAPPPTPKKPQSSGSSDGHGGLDRTFAAGFGLVFLFSACSFFWRKEYTTRKWSDSDGLNEGLLSESTKDQMPRTTIRQAGKKEGVHRIDRVGASGDQNGVEVGGLESGSAYTAEGRWIHMAEDAPTFAWPCLLFHRSLSSRTRYGVLIAMVGLILISGASNDSIGQSLILKINFEGEIIEIHTYDFSIASITHLLIKSGGGGVQLAICTAVFSLAWPYLKLVLMICAWVCPVWILPPRSRDMLMSFLDPLGKLGIFVGMVLILMLVSFKVHFNLWQDDLLLIDIITPIDFLGLGVIGYALVTIGSMLLAHVVRNSHRQCHEPTVVASDGGPQEAVSQHVFKIRGRRFQYSSAATGAVALLLVGTLVLLIVGAVSNFYTIQFIGIIGAILDLGPSTNTKDFTLLNLPVNGGPVIQLAFNSLTFAIPLLLLASLAVLWFKPMALHSQKRVLILTEILYAWSSLDVFMITALSALPHVRDFAVWLLAAPCVPLVPIIAAMPNLLEIAGGNTNCFDFDVILHSGCWFCLAAAILLHVVSQVVLQSACGAVENRLLEVGQISKADKALHHTLLALASMSSICGLATFEHGDAEDSDDDESVDGGRPNSIQDIDASGSGGGVARKHGQKIQRVPTNQLDL